jgi:hypothetical protein
LAIAACADPNGPEQNELNANLARWEAAEIEDYRFRFRRMCFCIFIDPVTIEVRAGQIASVVNADSGTVADTTQMSGYFLTVDARFEVIQDAIDREAHSLEVEYRTQRGYPTSIGIDYLGERR